MGLIDLLLIAYGTFILYGAIYRPSWYWDRGRIQRTRQMLGEQRTRTMYLALGSIMVGVGIWGALYF